MSRVPVTPENPLGLVRNMSASLFNGGYERDAVCPVCGRGDGHVWKVLTGSGFVISYHPPHESYVGPVRQGVIEGDRCPGSRMILEEYQPVTLEDCNRKLDEILEELEG